jgi:hypothetical protein
MVARLRAGRFDAAVIFTVYSQNPLPAALLCRLGGVPLRLAHCRENPYQLLTHRAEEPEPQGGIRHEVRRQFDLVATVGCRAADERLRLRVPDEALGWARETLAGFGLLGSRRWALIHPGATAPRAATLPRGSPRLPACSFASTVAPRSSSGRSRIANWSSWCGRAWERAITRSSAGWTWLG